MARKMTAEAYPHSRNDCDSCGSFDADLAANYPTLRGRNLRWCQHCAGRVLTHLVLTGHTVSVGPLDSDLPMAGLPLDDAEPGLVWTVDLAEKVLRYALPSASVFLRALIDAGGTATVEELRRRTGEDGLHYMTLTLNMAAKKVAKENRLNITGRLQIAEPRQDPADPRRTKVHDYAISAGMAPIFDEALQRLGR